MQLYTIKRQQTGNIIFSGQFSNFRACIEQAIIDEISLFQADLHGTNLLNAELDGGDFRQADFTGSNLSGANASECRMQGANLTGATLHGAVLCESDFDKALFDTALFGATDVFGCVLSACHFSTLSAFALNFSEAKTMSGSHFENPCGTQCAMSRPPLVINGLNQTIIMMDQHIKIGARVFALEEFTNLTPLSRLRGRLGDINLSRLRVNLEQLAHVLDIPQHADLTFHNKSA
jgi:uncharacterized protein YjbI with pentapeptide repeats